MEKYLAQTQGLLGLIQATISQEELNRSADAGTEMYEAIKEITAKYNLNVQEMMNATLGIHQTILEIAIEQLDKKKEEMGIE